MKKENTFANNVFVTTTDTTIGFISQNEKKLSDIKQRPHTKHYISALDSFHTLKKIARVPSYAKKKVRRVQKTTFILPQGKAYRVIQNKNHLLLLRRVKWAYTTSANLSGKAYSKAFALKNADVVVTPLVSNTQASHILKLGKTTLKRLR